MTFWQNVQVAAGGYPLGEGIFAWAVFGFVIVALILFWAVPTARTRLRAAALLVALACAGLLVAGALLSFGAAPADALFRWTRWVSLYLACIAIINLLSVLVFDVALDAIRLRPTRILRDVLLALAYLLVALTLLAHNGVNLTGIAATSAVITAIVVLSLQDTLGNLLSGVVLHLERFIRVGDWVRIDQQEGQVKEITWRHTAIETRNWDTIVLPNSTLMKNQVTLLARRMGAPRQRRQWVHFQVDHQHALTEVIETVEGGLRAALIPQIASEPALHCVVVDFKESAVTYAVRYWLTDLQVSEMTDSLVRTRIYFALQRAGIHLAIPTQAVFLTQQDETSQEREQRDELARRVTALQAIDLFQPLTDEERREVATRLHFAPFARGETILRQDAPSHRLYMLTKGEAEVRFALEGTHLSEKLTTLQAGECFGEMGLLTGELRSASVIALTDVECYRLDKEAFIDILTRRPQIAEDISGMLARRRGELGVVREGLTEEAMRQHLRRTEGDILRRIREFFRLDSGNGAKAQ